MYVIQTIPLADKLVNTKGVLIDKSDVARNHPMMFVKSCSGQFCLSSGDNSYKLPCSVHNAKYDKLLHQVLALLHYWVYCAESG